jgi:hypothetical protein
LIRVSSLFELMTFVIGLAIVIILFGGMQVAGAIMRQLVQFIFTWVPGLADDRVGWVINLLERTAPLQRSITPIQNRYQRRCTGQRPLRFRPD